VPRFALQFRFSKRCQKTVNVTPLLSVGFRVSAVPANGHKRRRRNPILHHTPNKQLHRRTTQRVPLDQLQTPRASLQRSLRRPLAKRHKHRTMNQTTNSKTKRRLSTESMTNTSCIARCKTFCSRFGKTVSPRLYARALNRRGIDQKITQQLIKPVSSPLRNGRNLDIGSFVNVNL